MTEPSARVLAAIPALSAATSGVRRAVRQVADLAYREGLRFPASLDYVLRDLERDLDRLALILHPSNIAEDLTRRDGGQAVSPPADAPAQDGREETLRGLDSNLPGSHSGA